MFSAAPKVSPFLDQQRGRLKNRLGIARPKGLQQLKFLKKEGTELIKHRSVA